MNAASIEVRELTRCYDSFLAVDHVSFEVEPGEIFGFLGPNGDDAPECRAAAADVHQRDLHRHTHPAAGRRHP